MKLTLKPLTAALALIASPAVLAGTGSGMAAIEHVGNFNGTDLVFFYTAVHGNVPSCNEYRKRWALDISTSLGRAQYAYLLSAVAAGKEIEVGGSGDCSFYFDSEAVQWIGQPINYTGTSADIPSF